MGVKKECMLTLSRPQNGGVNKQCMYTLSRATDSRCEEAMYVDTVLGDRMWM